MGQIGVEQRLFTQGLGCIYLYTQPTGNPPPPLPKTSAELKKSLTPEEIFNDAYTHCENTQNCTDFYL